MISKILLVLFSGHLLFLAGCCKSENTQEEEDEVGVEDVVDYAIGKTQIEQMKKSEKKIERISENHNRQLEEALEEMDGAGR